MSALPVPSQPQPIPAPGATLHMRLGGTRQRLDGVIVRWSGRIGVVDVSERIASGSSVILRLVDESGSAWTAQGVAGSADVLRRQLAVRLVGPWQAADSRRAERVAAPGLAVTCTHAGRQLDLVTVDVSPTGLRASGHGEAPHVNDHVELVPRAGEGLRRPLLARVVRVERTSETDFEIAVAFTIETALDRAAAAWLVGIARRGG